MQTTSPAFKENARRAPVDTGLRKSLARSKPSFRAKRTGAVMGLPKFERLRDIGREIKNHTLAQLDFHLDRYAENVERVGGTLHRCGTADDAHAAVLELCREAGARTVTKGESPIGEELALLELGAHGPRRLHVVLIEDDPAALTPEGHA